MTYLDIAILLMKHQEKPTYKLRMLRSPSMRTKTIITTAKKECIPPSLLNGAIKRKRLQ